MNLVRPRAAASTGVDSNTLYHLGGSEWPTSFVDSESALPRTRLLSANSLHPGQIFRVRSLSAFDPDRFDLPTVDEEPLTTEEYQGGSGGP